MHRKKNVSTTTEDLPRDFPQLTSPTAGPPPQPTATHCPSCPPLYSPSTPNGEIQQTLAVQELGCLAELPGRIGIVVLLLDHPSMAPRRVPLSLPQLLSCIGPRAWHDLVCVEHS